MQLLGMRGASAFCASDPIGAARAGDPQRARDLVLPEGAGLPWVTTACSNALRRRAW